MAEEEEEAGGEERPSMAQFSALTTYSDLITLMASFFLLMFMIALQEQSKAKATMETVMQAVAKQFGNYPPRGAAAPSPTAGGGEGGKAEADMRHGPPGKREEVRALTADEKQKLAFGDELLFQSGSSELTQSAQRVLQREVAPDMSGFGNRIEIRGHSADKEQEKGADPWDLGYARAQAVMRYLVTECEMDATRFRLISCGDNEPVHRSKPETNRRVEVIMSESVIAGHSPDTN